MDITSPSLYLTLPSNSSKDKFPDNKAGCYKVKLSHAIKLKHNYEVALAEIIFTKSWLTINTQCALFLADHGSGYKWFCIKKGFYEDIPTVILDMQKSLQEYQYNNIEFEYSHITKRVKVLLKNGAKIKLRKGLAQMLGLPEMIDIDETTEGTHAADIRRGMTAIYVYCNIIEPQFVGDALVPLLRIVDSNGQNNEIITKTFTSPHYLPVRSREIDTIEINICDDTGEILSFSTGKVICKLHLRLRHTL